MRTNRRLDQPTTDRGSPGSHPRPLGFLMPREPDHRRRRKRYGTSNETRNPWPPTMPGTADHPEPTAMCQNPADIDTNPTEPAESAQI